MCSIVGAMLPVRDAGAVTRLQLLYSRSRDRGRDSAGLTAIWPNGEVTRVGDAIPDGPYTAVGNLRGEPTTEWVREKTEADAQPFTSPSGRWVFTHNGTIANDNEIAYQLDPVDGKFEWPTLIDSYAIGVALDMYGWPVALQRLRGSFAILAVDRSEPGTMYWAANYKPLYVLGSKSGSSTLFASQREYFDHMYKALSEPGPVALGPYEYGTVKTNPITGELSIFRNPLYPPRSGHRKVLAVCSGGLDSSVGAWWHAAQGDEVTLLHLQYGCKAEGPEVTAIHQLAEALNRPAMFVQTDFFTKTADSVLTRTGSAINHERSGQEGAELAHEWVPARNLVMASLALAIAERHGFDAISFGTNLEEAGAYPDNEPEFLNLLQAVVPYAVRAYQQIEILSPVSTRMKKEIVELGASVGMPFELTWSCYEGGAVHCGTCGPCFMRRTAFRMANIPDPTIYADSPVTA